MTDERDLRPDQETDSRVSSWLTATDLSADEAHSGLDRLLDAFPVTPQARRRFLGRWLDRDEGVGRHAVDHDPPPNTNRRNSLMLSATGITAALAILAISVNVIDMNPMTPGAEGGATHVVAADGSGDFDSIQAAVDAASDGDIVSIKPGRYDGTITVERDITITGDGPLEEVVIVAPAGEAQRAWEEFDEGSRPHGLFIEGAAATITGLTVEVSPWATGIGSDAGSPVVERVSIVNTGPVPQDESNQTYYSLWFNGQGDAVVRDSEWDGYAAVREGAAAVFEGNTVSADGISIDGPGASTVRGNTFSDGGWVNATGAILTVEGNEFGGGDVTADSRSVLEVRDNVFRDHLRGEFSEAAITLWHPGTRATLENNTIAGSDNGIVFLEGAAGSIVGNTIEASRIAVQVDGGLGSQVVSNAITGDGAGILIGRGSDALVEGNEIDVATRGIAIANGSTPSVSGNVVCGGDESIWVGKDATPELGDNEVC